MAQRFTPGADRIKLNELLEKAKNYIMTPEELRAQRESWVRGELGLSGYSQERIDDAIIYLKKIGQL
jgi:hypothetical protein